MSSAQLHNSQVIPIVHKICDWWDEQEDTEGFGDELTIHVNGIEWQFNHVREIEDDVEELVERLSYAREKLESEDQKLSSMIKDAEKSFYKL